MNTYIHYGHKKFHRNDFHPVKNVMFYTKPDGGLWASNVNTEFGWKEWCDLFEYRKCEEENSFIFSLQRNAKVLYIRSIEEISILPQVQQIFKQEIIPFPSSWVFLDFEEIAKNYDAIEISISSDTRISNKLYGWDCDSILIMNPNIIQIL